MRINLAGRLTNHVAEMSGRGQGDAGLWEVKCPGYEIA